MERRRGRLFEFKKNQRLENTHETECQERNDRMGYKQAKERFRTTHTSQIVRMQSDSESSPFNWSV